ncbi:hypothetical protein [Escherichia coli]|uniref:hypothetical protein n=1 Tax=Escherichia coli TaxID=562 RepID=UPI00101F04B9|nr:hypothetical protein [Escherichia coli]EFE7739078.1 hypothetical protein [Escherichia coli]EFL9697131.1 hypothetical protein [Escherichia coli]EGI4656011.1 hypothetical protein [Escherichia coli]EHX1544985.1 hypothetical protein [Escherichia coli]EIO6538181.1 hypothetical protein [Escherichia coli]
MPLKYQLTAEEYAQLDETKQSLYALQGEVYICQIEGLPQPEDVTGLKRKNEELLAEKRASDERRRAAEEEARRKEEERLAAEGNFKQLYESSQTKTAEWEQRYSQLEQSIHQRDINLAATRIATAIADGDNADILKEFIAKRLKVAEGQVRVTDDSGNLTVSALADLQREFETAPRYASLVRGSQAGGGGAAPKSGDRVTKSFGELRGMERVQLRKDNPAEYERLKKAHEASK